MKQVYQMDVDKVFTQMQTNEKGLSMQRAKELLEEKGENVLEEGKKKTAVMVFLEQFKDLLVMILIIAAIVSAVSGNAESTVVKIGRAHV